MQARLFVKQSLDSSKRGDAPLEQVRYPTDRHHRPGHEQEIIDEGHEITRRDRPLNRHSASKDEDQEETGIGNESGNRKQSAIHKGKFEIVANVGFAHAFKPLSLGCFLIVSLDQPHGRKRGTGKLRQRGKLFLNFLKMPVQT